MYLHEMGIFDFCDTRIEFFFGVYDLYFICSPVFFNFFQIQIQRVSPHKKYGSFQLIDTNLK